MDLNLLPVVRDTAVILAFRTATVLTLGAVGNTSPLVRSQDKVVWTGARVRDPVKVVGSYQA